VSNAFIGEIRMFGGNFAPVGWAFCMGQLMAISENEALFQLLGTTYGGDGQTTFGLPDLQGRVPVHQGTQQGNTYVIGEKAGVESVTLTSNQMPTHNHLILSASAASGGAVAVPAINTVLGDEVLNPVPNPVPFAYLPNGGAATVLAPQSLGQAGGSQPHDNMQPSLTITYIISLFGIFPARN
jgi:microcystin-dependent protein